MELFNTKTISFKEEKIFIIGATFEEEYGVIVGETKNNIIIELTDKETNYKFTRCFNKRSGKAVGVYRKKLKVLI